MGNGQKSWPMFCTLSFHGREEMMYFQKRTTAVILLLALLMGVLVSCGGTGADGTSPLPAPNNPSPSPVSPINPPSEPPEDLPPAIEESFTISGNGTYTTQSQIRTDTILEVRVHSGSGGGLTHPSYPGHSINYTCIQYTVEVLGRTRTSRLLTVNPGSSALCLSAPSYDTFNFSDRLSHSGQEVAVTVKEVRYDFYCLLWWQYYFAGVNPDSIVGPYSNVCPTKPVYSTHTIRGSLEIRINDTQFRR